MIKQIITAHKTGQDAYDKEMLAQSRIGQALAAMQHSKASASAAEAKAAKDNAERDAFMGRQDLFREQTAIGAGTDIPTVDAYRAKLRGESPQVPMGPPTETGDMGVGSFQAGPETTSKLAGAIRQNLPLLFNLKDIKPDDWAQADQIYGNQRLRDQVVAGQADAGTVGRAQAAMAGKDLFKADSTGMVLDQFGGETDTSNPVAQATIAERNAKAKKLRAGGGGGSSVGGKPSGKAPSGYQWTTDPATGQSVLKAIPGGPADKPQPAPKPPTEGQSKALLFGSRMAIADEILNELDAKGQRTPNLIKAGLETVPLIGGALGMAANQIATPGEQQVEQAQRDFINAVLRRESGASISAPEFSNAVRQYFPQPGDFPDVRRNKAQNRRTAIEGMKAEFGEPGMGQFLQTVRAARADRQPKAPAPAKPAAAPGAPARNVQVNY